MSVLNDERWFEYKNIRSKSYYPLLIHLRVKMTLNTNGVNVDQLVGTSNAIKETPSIADFKFNATTKWIKGGHCQTHIQHFTGANTTDTSRDEAFVLEGDEPPVLLGENHGVNAVEALLHAIGSCLSVGMVYNASARGIVVSSLTFDITGEINLHGFLGLSETSRPGYSNICVNVDLESDASRETEEELCEYVIKTSPMVDCVRNPVPLTIKLL